MKWEIVEVFVVVGGRRGGREGTGEEGGVDLLPLTEKGSCPKGPCCMSWPGELPWLFPCS